MAEVFDDRRRAYRHRNRHRCRPLSLLNLDSVGIEHTSQENKRDWSGLHELIAWEILSRLPVRSLIRFKCVCRSWYALISDPSFEAAYQRRARERPPQLVIATFADGRREEIDMYAYDRSCTRRRARFLSGKRFPRQSVLMPPQHCNGLVLLPTQAELVVCNPATNEFVTLPRGHRNVLNWRPDCSDFRAGFGYVPSIDAYKVGRYFYREYDFCYGSSSLGFEVLTLGTDSSWRAVEDPPLPIGFLCPESVGEAIYYRVFNILHTSAPRAFVCFGLRDEKFRVVDPPSQELTRESSMSIVGLEGKPCFVYRHQDGTKYDLWISEDCEVHTWVHSYSIDLLEPSRYVLPVAVSHGKLLLKVGNVAEEHAWPLLRSEDGYRRLAYYDPQSKSFERTVQVDRDVDFYKRSDWGFHFLDESWPFQVFSYVESLASIRNMN